MWAIGVNGTEGWGDELGEGGSGESSPVIRRALRPKGEIEEAPLDEDDDAALEFDDVDQVDEEPDAPGNEARDMYAENVGDGRRRGPMTAISPLSKYLNGGRVRPARRALMSLAAYFPPWMATWATPGSGLPFAS